jgi:tetratricopeptide (TPR) repeat protein
MKMTFQKSGRRWLPGVFLAMVGGFALVIGLSAAESPTEVERVGELGRKDCLVFEGTQAFSAAGILSPLELRLEFYSLSAPAAPLSDYLAWIQRSVRLGYQRSGFAKAVVTATADRKAQRIRVSVSEGPRFNCGAAKVTGLEPALAERLTNRLHLASTLTEPAKGPGLPCFPWPWREGGHVPVDPLSLTGFERSVVAALAELNRHQAEAQVELTFDENRRQADLLIQVTKPGVVGTLDQIEVEGLRRNSREELLSYLQLRPGMPLSGNVTNDTSRRLWDSGRFSGQLMSLSPLTEPGRFRLDLTVVEFTNAPPLRQELTAEEKAFMKLRDWVLNWKNRPEDWVFEAQMTRSGRRANAKVVFGQEGLAILMRQPSATNAAALRYGFVAAPQHIGFYSGPEQSKLVGKAMGGQYETIVAMGGNPEHDNDRGHVHVGGGWHNKSLGTPYSMRLDLAPVFFVALAHPLDGSCRLAQGILSVQSETNADIAFEMTAEATTGRLMAWHMSMQTNDVRLVLRCEEGAFARVLREVAAGSAAFTNALDPRHPWSSSLAMLGRDLRETLEKDFPEVLDWLGEGLAGRANAKELFNAVAVLEEFPWRALVAPLDFFSSSPSEPDTGEEFPFVLDGSVPSLTAGNDWVRLLGGGIMRASDVLWPRGSWPWALMRDATFLAAGEARLATNDTARLAQAEDTGPLGCLIAAHALGRFDPRMAVTFSQQGAARATPAALQDDLRVLLRGEKAGQRFLQSSLRRAPVFKEKDLLALMKLIGTNALPIVFDCFTALRANSSLPPDEALRPVIERHWERQIRPPLLTVFAKLCLTGYLASSPRPDASQATAAAGWLREAADQGYAPAQIWLGQFYAKGLGVNIDSKVAAMWMGKAVEQGYPHATCELGRLYLSLNDREEAARWFRRGTQDACSTAEMELAKLLLGATGATREQQEEGIALLRKAAGHNSVEAWFYLGMAYEQLKRMEEALDSYRKAAFKGLAEAQLKLGVLLSDGFITKPDYVEAWVWLKQAASKGSRFADTLSRTIGRKLTAEQLEDGRRRLSQIDKGAGWQGKELIPKL